MTQAFVMLILDHLALFSGFYSFFRSDGLLDV